MPTIVASASGELTTRPGKARRQSLRETEDAALRVFDVFAEDYGIRQAVQCLAQRDVERSRHRFAASSRRTAAGAPRDRGPNSLVLAESACGAGSFSAVA